MQQNNAFIALGANLGDPAKQIHQALKAISDFAFIKATSSLYISKPFGGMQQPDYVNAVIEIKTDFTPLQLLKKLQDIENNQGRIREFKWQARTLDLDILLFDDEILNLTELKIPHPEMFKREFVIIPLFEIAPNLILPTGQKIQDLQQNFANHTMQIIKACDN